MVWFKVFIISFLLFFFWFNLIFLFIVKKLVVEVKVDLNEMVEFIKFDVFFDDDVGFGLNFSSVILSEVELSRVSLISVVLMSSIIVLISGLIGRKGRKGRKGKGKGNGRKGKGCKGIKGWKGKGRKGRKGDVFEDNVFNVDDFVEE